MEIVDRLLGLDHIARIVCVAALSVPEGTEIVEWNETLSAPRWHHAVIEHYFFVRICIRRCDWLIIKLDFCSENNVAADVLVSEIRVLLDVNHEQYGTRDEVSPGRHTIPVCLDPLVKLLHVFFDEVYRRTHWCGHVQFSLL